jgi:hypothetical protein
MSGSTSSTVRSISSSAIRHFAWCR